MDKYLEIYNKYSEEKICQKDISAIYIKLNEILSRINLDEIEIVETIDALLYFYNNNLLEKINEESLTLLSKILGNEDGQYFSEDTLHFVKYLKNLLIPFDLNHCDYEYNLNYFLGEFDVFFNLIILNLNNEELLLIQNYNPELFEIVLRCKYIIVKYLNNNSVQNGFVTNNFIIDNTMMHLATMLYFSLSEFRNDKDEYNYELLEQVFNRLISNFNEYLISCFEYGIYENGIDTIFNPKNIGNEYLICKKMLEQEQRLSIKEYQKRR